MRLSFFTNLSSRLLSASGYPFDANNIPVYTNNSFVFTPDVHRILQVAANIYDAETNHYTAPGDLGLPTVLRPTFRRTVDGVYTNIYIGGYAEVGAVTGANDPQLALPLDLNDVADRAVAGAVPDQNIYDVPWIIGVKKGFPNFNEFAMQSVSRITRRLQLRRPTLTSRPNVTNQLFVVGISNVFAFEGWNSYASNYARAVQVIAANDMVIGFAYTNDPTFDQRGSNIAMRVAVGTVTNIDSDAWPGYGRRITVPAKASFVVPLITNVTFLPDSYFRTESTPAFTTNADQGINLFQGFEQTGRFALPQLNLSISNRIRFILLDTTSGRVVDYIQLGLNGVRDLSAELIDSDSGVFVDGTTGQSSSETIFWQTNRFGDGFLSSPPLGVICQIEASLGNINVPNWNALGIAQASGVTKQKQIQAFRDFCLGAGTNLDMVVPFTPTRKTSQYLAWQANDPLVHFTRQDLTYFGIGDGIIREQPNGPIQPLRNIGVLNDRFEPWGGNPASSLISTIPLFGVAYKDPSASSSDLWDFASRGPISVAWLGRVHRGTPWQTLYLKSGDIEAIRWSKWTGWDIDAGILGRPVKDRPLISALAMLLNTNPPSSLFSINSTDTNAWRQALDGVTVITNTSTDDELFSNPPIVQFETNIMNSGSAQAGVIAEAILQARGGGTWAGVGDVLGTSDLSVASPWLNTNSAVQLQYGISEEAYEAIATQLLPRLRQDSVGVMARNGGTPMIEFSGYDGFPYVTEVSGDLVSWTAVSTNYPVNGKWSFGDVVGVGAGQRFYRSRLLP